MKIYLYPFESEKKSHVFNDVYKVEITLFTDLEFALFDETFGNVQVGDMCYFVHLFDGHVFVFKFYEYMLNISI